MSDKKPRSQDIHNLFDLVEVIWKESVTIVFVTLVTLVLGLLFIYSNEKQYVTSIGFKVDVIPPFLEKREALADIKQFFARPDLFSEWKKSNPDSNFTFDMIDERQIIDGNIFAIDESGRFIVIDSGQLVVRSDDIDLVSDVAGYLSFVNSDLTQIYFDEAKRSQTLVDSVFNGSELNLNYRNGVTVKNMDRAIVNRFVFKVEQGLKILKISRPNAPKRKNYRPKMTLAVFLFLGLTLGSIFVLVRNAYRQR